MTTDPQNKPTPDQTETERVRIWREERARVAETERLERAKNATADRKRQLAEEEAARIAKAASLLPDEAELNNVRHQLHIERQIRRRRTIFQVALFVLLPTVLVALYVSLIAVPLYEARSVFTIAKPGQQTDSGLSGVLGSFSPNVYLSESFMAQEYIQSRVLMNELEAEIGILSYYGSPEMDPLRRLRDIAPLQINTQTFFRRYVSVAVNSRVGLVSLYVRARSPEDAQRFSDAILTKAETHINSLSESLFDEQVRKTEIAVGEARRALETARLDLIRLQVESGDVNPRERVAVIYATIATLEQEIINVLSEVQKIELAGYADTVQVQRLRDAKVSLQGRIALQRQALVDTSRGVSLNQTLADYEFALVQQEISQQSWASALAALTQARSAAALGISRFQISVQPRASSIPSHPNRIRTTLLALLFFLGLFSVVRVFRPGYE